MTDTRVLVLREDRFCEWMEYEEALEQFRLDDDTWDIHLDSWDISIIFSDERNQSLLETNELGFPWTCLGEIEGPIILLGRLNEDEGHQFKPLLLEALHDYLPYINRYWRAKPNYDEMNNILEGLRPMLIGI